MILALVRQMFRYAVDRDIIEFDPTASIRKSKIGGKSVEHDRVLNEDEIRELCRKLPNANMLPSTECAIWIMLSTCCRVGELSKARWEHVDFAAKTWLIPDEHSKNGKPHTIYPNLPCVNLNDYPNFGNLILGYSWIEAKLIMCAIRAYLNK